MGLLFMMPNHLLIRLIDNAAENESWKNSMHSFVSDQIGTPLDKLYRNNGPKLFGFFVVTVDETMSLNKIRDAITKIWMDPPKNESRSFYFGDGIGSSMNYKSVRGLSRTTYQAAFFDYTQNFKNSATSVNTRPNPNCRDNQFSKITEFLQSNG
jgi:hypothetical protein